MNCEEVNDDELICFFLGYASIPDLYPLKKESKFTEFQKQLKFYCSDVSEEEYAKIYRGLGGREINDLFVIYQLAYVHGMASGYEPIQEETTELALFDWNFFVFQMKYFELQPEPIKLTGKQILCYLFGLFYCTPKNEDDFIEFHESFMKFLEFACKRWNIEYEKENFLDLDYIFSTEQTIDYLYDVANSLLWGISSEIKTDSADDPELYNFQVNNR